MLEKLRNLFRGPPRKITVYPEHCSDEWAVAWRDPMGNVTERSCESKDDALAYAGQQVSRLQRNGVRTDLKVIEEWKPPEVRT